MVPYGEIIETTPDLGPKSTIKSVISVSLPLWKGGNKGELTTLEKGI